MTFRVAMREKGNGKLSKIRPVGGELQVNR